MPSTGPCVSKPFTTSFLIPDLYRSRSLPPTLRRSPSALSPSLLVACVSRARIMAQPAGPEGADWKAKLNLPPKDTRIRTEVGSWMECSPSASAGRHSPHTSSLQAVQVVKGCTPVRNVLGQRSVWASGACSHRLAPLGRCERWRPRRGLTSFH